MVVAKAAGTVNNAGWVTNHGAQPPPNRLRMLSTIANSTSEPPTTRPAVAPIQVSPRHQIPSTSSGQNVDAARAKDRPTLSERSSIGSSTAPAAAVPATTTAARRKSRTRAQSRSVEITEATLTSSPDEVDRNAANAPAASTATVIAPATPGSIAPGSSSTAASVFPVSSSCGTYNRDNAPSSTGNR